MCCKIDWQLWPILSSGPLGSKADRLIFGGFAARWMVSCAVSVAVAVLVVFLFLFLCRVHPILGFFLRAYSVLVSLCSSAGTLMAGVVVVAAGKVSGFPLAEVLMDLL